MEKARRSVVIAGTASYSVGMAFSSDNKIMSGSARTGSACASAIINSFCLSRLVAGFPKFQHASYLFSSLRNSIEVLIQPSPGIQSADSSSLISPVQRSTK
jgi:hypothetical protein